MQSFLMQNPYTVIDVVLIKVICKKILAIRRGYKSKWRIQQTQFLSNIDIGILDGKILYNHPKLDNYTENSV